MLDELASYLTGNMPLERGTSFGANKCYQHSE